MFFLVSSVVDFADREQVKCRNNGDTDVCLSLDQVVAGPGVDLNEAAVESEHQRSLLKDLVERTLWLTLSPFGFLIARSPLYSGKM